MKYATQTALSKLTQSKYELNENPQVGRICPHLHYISKDPSFQRGDCASDWASCAIKVCNYNYRGKAAIHFTGVVCRKC